MKEIFKGKRSLKNVGKNSIYWLAWLVFISAAVIAGFIVRDFAEVTAERNEQIARQIETQTEQLHRRSAPQKAYRQARKALLDNDLEGVLDEIHPTLRERYRDALEGPYKENNLPKIAENVIPLTEKVAEEDDTVVYKTEPITASSGSNIFHNSQKYVEFTKTDKNVWKISS